MQQWGKSARLHVFAKVHAAQIEPARVRFVGFFSAGEGRVVAAARRRDLPGQQARRDGHDGVQMARLELLGKAGEREHAGVLCADVVGEREAVLRIAWRAVSRLYCLWLFSPRLSAKNCVLQPAT